MGPTICHWGHEPAWAIRRKGAKIPFYGERDQSTVWRVLSPKMIMGGNPQPGVRNREGSANLAELLEGDRLGRLDKIGHEGIDAGRDRVLVVDPRPLREDRSRPGSVGQAT
ncbi:MAG: hypothetical protein ACRDGI_06900 [Candidatus Limnocylindrales bacterium]